MQIKRSRTHYQGYERLQRVLEDALAQAARGKGAQRHATTTGQPFHEQLICELGRHVGTGFGLGQAAKKVLEAGRLPDPAAIAELYGAINYIAAAIILIEDRQNTEDLEAIAQLNLDSSKLRSQEDPLLASLKAEAAVGSEFERNMLNDGPA